VTTSYKIGFDYTAAVHQQAGIGRYVRELASALTTLHPEADWHLFAADAVGAPPPLDSASWHPSPLRERNLARVWHRLRLPLPIELWTGPLDLYHATDFALPPTQKSTRRVVTVHDVAWEHFPDQTMPGMLNHLRRVVPRSTHSADRVITVSEAAKQDLHTFYDVPLEKISVVQHGVEERFSPKAEPGEVEHLRQTYHLPDKPFILTVGTLQPRKNHRRLVQAFADVGGGGQDTALVIAGGYGWDYENVRADVERLGLADAVYFPGFVRDEDLPALYRAAGVFAYPSLNEGFGMPVLEAMACGIPVVTSNVSALPEVAGDAALLIDPLDVGALADALKRSLTDSKLHGELRQRGLEHAAQYTWRRAAELTWSIYESVL